jgi:hypothetical protein
VAKQAPVVEVAQLAVAEAVLMAVQMAVQVAAAAALTVVVEVVLWAAQVLLAAAPGTSSVAELAVLMALAAAAALYPRRS